MLPLAPADKANHALYGALTCAVVTCLLLAADVAIETLVPALKDWRMSPVLAALTGLIASVVSGVGKEAWDWWQNRRAGVQVHTVDLMDAAWTVAGGVIVAGPRLIEAMALGW